MHKKGEIRLQIEPAARLKVIANIWPDGYRVLPPTRAPHPKNHLPPQSTPLPAPPSPSPSMPKKPAQTRLVLEQ